MIELPKYEAIEEEVRGYGYTIEQWCKLIDIAPSSWRRWRNGEFYPSIGKLKDLDAALKKVRKKNAELAA